MFICKHCSNHYLGSSLCTQSNGKAVDSANTTKTTQQNPIIDYFVLSLSQRVKALGISRIKKTK